MTDVWLDIRTEMLGRFADMAEVEPVAISLADQWLSAMRDAAREIGLTLDENARKAVVYLCWMIVNVCVESMDEDAQTPPAFGAEMGGASLALARSLLGP